MTKEKPYEGMHEHPAGVPETNKKQPSSKDWEVITDRTMICTRHGCGCEFWEDKNEKGSCVHHPGVYQFGSWMGLWPESWTCCWSPWDTPGCWKGKHKGTPKDAPSKFCVNHGEVNPESATNKRISPYPDWFCGKNYIAYPPIPDWKWKPEDPE